MKSELATYKTNNFHAQLELENTVREVGAVLQLLGEQAIKSFEQQGDSMKFVVTGTHYLMEATQAKLTAAFDKSWKERATYERALEAKIKGGRVEN